MLRILQAGNSLPYSWICDPSASFQPGMIGQLSVSGGQIVATVSNGTAPLGIIDDIKVNAFSTTVWDETIRVPATGVVAPGGRLITPVDIVVPLNNPNIIPSSFISLDVDVQLIPRNGIIIFPAGTVLNFDMTGSGSPNAIRTIVRYQYQIPNVIGDDSTQGSGRVTIWFQRMLIQTDQIDTTAIYPLNANLFVNEHGLFTTRQPTPNHPSVGLVTGPPSSLLGSLELMWL